MKKGRIIRVAGPLVQAVDLPGVKMYEVVHIGKQGLIGEVIEIQGEVISIQVYEETGGIAPGEEVERTFSSLSVELGPGLITSIYDGIQRPLNLVREKVGDFIVRGVKVPALNRDKIWHFKPLVKDGDEVKEFSILGEVEETPAVKTKIMVPPGISGRVEGIKEGNFKITDTICKVGGKEVKMFFNWPVRTPLPYLKKIAVFEPLITGTRIIDTFFPVAKGGTACIPGPFGSGKCLHPATPVLLSNGKILTIKEVYDMYQGRGKKYKKVNEEYTILSKPFCVFGWDRGKIKKFKVKAVYKGKTYSLVKITTRSGRTLSITPVHKLFTFRDLKIEKKQAQYLRAGEYLIMPRKILSKSKLERIPWQKIFENFRIAEPQILKQLKIILKELKEKYTFKEIARKLNVSFNCLIGWWTGKNHPPFKIVKKLYRIKGKKLPEIFYFKGETSSSMTKVPHKWSRELALFLGLITGDGQVKGRSIRFYNTDPQIQKIYEKTVKKVFDIKVKKVKMRTVECLVFESPVVKKLLDFFGFPEYRKSKNVKLPVGLLKNNVEILSSFLSGLFITDGSFNSKKGEIEISTASFALKRELSYLLLFCGINATFREKISGKFKSTRIFIRGKEEIEKFYKLCVLASKKFEEIARYLKSSKRSYNSRDIVPLNKEFIRDIYEKCGKPYAEWKRQGIEIFNYLAGENMGKKIFQKFAEVSGERDLQKFATNHISEIFIDRIEKIEWIKKEQDVYDIEVEDAHNFIGGDIPCFFSNTVVLHQLAKWSDADIIVYIGCGERGNEMTDVLIEFPELKDPRSGRPLLERTVLIANTSNMPVAAREASIYTGITIAEFFRNMGYKVAVMADSTSRWAEALREMSGRLEEMPGEEGYPAYLASRIAAFYERSGVVEIENPPRRGSVSVIGAVSPPGGDLSDPVVQATLRMVKVFWSLEDKLAYQRHFPAINWLNSYSLYVDDLEEFYEKNEMKNFLKIRAKALKILQQEAELQEIVRLVGFEALSDEDKLILDAAKMFREDFLHQHAFDPQDTYTEMKKQYKMLSIMMIYVDEARQAIKNGISFSEISGILAKEKIARMKYMSLDEIEEVEKLLKDEMRKLFGEG